MKSCILFTLFLSVGMWAGAEIRITLCNPNNLHPLWTQEVMLGSPVSLVVHSDANDLWSGGLFIPDACRMTGRLSCRNLLNDPNSVFGQASCMEAAGQQAFVLKWDDSWMSGFDLYTGECKRSPGNWFVLDYTPQTEGICTVQFYDHDVSWTTADPNMTLSIINTPTRDWNNDGLVNFEDYAVLAASWMADDCDDPNWCGGADLDRSGSVDLTDVIMFADFWLWGTPNWKRSNEPVEPSPGVEQNDPNIFYAILDPNGLNEITLYVGQSIQLYLDKTTYNENVYIFNIEVNISDPNLGWIDNTEYDSSNPDTSTAELLAAPRTTFFDYWGPGYTQNEGIQFLAASFSGAIADGPIASFVYTATAVGDVTLSPFEYLEDRPVGLLPILIHQIAPAPVQSTSTSQAQPITESMIDQMVETLETLWQQEPAMQETIEEEQWNEFIDAVKSSATEEIVE
jgi:hypothetical protein